MTTSPLIAIVPENCRGCRRCQVACSSYDPGPLNPRLAGIQVLNLEEGHSYPVMNVECREKFCGKSRPGTKDSIPACVAACLFGALEGGAR
jgi:Fe-S-cluster-containing dehydrogenase component